MVGSNWGKADLHVHTRHSAEATDQGSILEIIEKAALEGISILGITDHNSGEGIDETKEVVWGFNERHPDKQITVVPGIEVSTEVGHILGLFGVDKDTAFIRDFLSRIGISPADYGKTEVNSSKSVKEIVEIVHDSGGIAIAAHVDISGSVFRSAGPTLATVLGVGYLDALEIKDLSNAEDFRQRCNSLANRILPILNFSDAHKLADIGKNYTFFKLEEVHSHGLKICLREWENRIKYPGDDLTPQHLYIDSIKIEGGFLDGVELELHPNLNCIVGGKGVGKSLLVEFLRYALGDNPKIAELLTDMETKVEKQLGENGRVTVGFKEADGEYKVLELFYGGEGDARRSMVSRDSGEDTALSIQPRFFSQTEIIKIAEDPLKIDDVLYEGLDLYHEKAAIEECRQALAQNGHTISTLVEEKTLLQSYIGDKSEGIKPTEERIKYLEHKIEKYGPVIGLFNEYEFLDKKVKKLALDLDGLSIYPAEEISAAIPALEYLETIEGIREKMGKVIDLLEVQDPKVEILVNFELIYNKVVNGFRSNIEPLIDEWRTFFEEKEQEYVTALVSVEEGTIDIKDWNEELTDKKRKLAELNRGLKRVSEIEKELETKRKEREGLRSSYLAAITMLRAKKERWNDRIKEKLRGELNIGIRDFAYKEVYKSELEKLGEGSYLRPEDYDVIIKKFPTPNELVSAYEYYWEHKELPSDVSASEMADKLRRMFATWDAKWDLEEILKLETLFLEDIVDVKYRVHGVLKPLDELSVGQKSTAMISLAMASGPEPLIIDQPEDALDSIFIYDRIVKDIRTKKNTRQFILVSHNANVVVNGDADFCVVLDATESQGRIFESGGIEKIRLNEQILARLEGGPDAFANRRNKYFGTV